MRTFIKFLMYASLTLDSLAMAVTDSGKTIMVDHKDKQFVISLASTPSTGFSWLLDSYDLNKIKLVEHRYIAPAKSMPGKSGTEDWVFAVNPAITAGPQVIKIGLIHARMWDVENTMSKNLIFTIVIY